MSAEILSLEQVKTLLQISGTGSDAQLSAALPVVTEYFENYCKRGLAYVADVIEEQTLPSPRLPLFRYPIDTVAEVLIDGAAIALAPIPPRVDQARGFIYLGYDYCFPYGRQLVRVTYSGGYPQDEVPADLASAYARCCADLAGVVYPKGGADGAGAPLKSLGLGSGALTVAFDTGGAAAAVYDTSAVPPLLAPYLWALDHYQLKDFV